VEEVPAATSLAFAAYTSAARFSLSSSSFNLLFSFSNSSFFFSSSLSLLSFALRLLSSSDSFGRDEKISSPPNNEVSMNLDKPQRNPPPFLLFFFAVKLYCIKCKNIFFFACM
jgi:hypothetical protein